MTTVVVLFGAMDTKLLALQKAVEVAGGQSALARALGCKQQHVWNWLHRDGRVPAEACRAIEAVTKGKVTRYDLRPDVFGDSPEGGAA